MTAMDEKGLKRLLRIPDSAMDRPGVGCPDEGHLAAYVEHRLSANDEARIESHLADCDACLGQVAFLVRQPEQAGSPVAPPLLSRARDLVAARPSAWRTPVLRWGAVAATAALCVVVVLNLRVSAPEGPLSPRPPAPSVPAPAAVPPTAAPQKAVPTSPAPPVVRKRNSATRPLRLELLAPAENATLSSGHMEFAWQAVPDANYYEVFVVTEDGNVAWQGKVEGTRARPPEGVPPEAGKKYFVWIRAYLSGGGTLKSAAVAFYVGGR